MVVFQVIELVDPYPIVPFAMNLKNINYEINDNCQLEISKLRNRA